MFRKLIPLPVLIVLVLGCKKSAEDPGGGSGTGDPAPNSASYTINIGEAHKGDKTRVVWTSSQTMTLTVEGKPERTKDQDKFDYTQEILEVSKGGPSKPTKLVRVYKTAERSEEGGALKPLPYAGKTVTIEENPVKSKGGKNKGGSYTATVDGQPILGPDAVELTSGYESAEKFKNEELLPKKAVRVNESWTVERETVERFGAAMGMEIDPARSSVTGKLSKAYTKGDKQWGVIELRIELVAATDPADKGAAGSHKRTGEMTLETPIDGSSSEGIMKSRWKETVTVTNNGKPSQSVIDSVSEQTITLAK